MIHTIALSRQYAHMMTILLLYSKVEWFFLFWFFWFFFFWREFDTYSLFKFSTTFTIFQFLPFTFSLNANFHQSIFSKCKVNSLSFRLRTGMVYVVKRTNKGLCKIRLKGVDYGNTPYNDGMIIRTVGKAFFGCDKKIS